MANANPKSRRTSIKIGIPKTEYVADEGAKTEYKTVAVAASESGDVTDIFYCEWTNAFGTLAIQFEQQKIPNPARVRMSFVKEIYAALINKAARIFKDGIIDGEHTYMLNSSVDNVGNENKILEFNVKRDEEV